jgi:hypothetical protein
MKTKLLMMTTAALFAGTLAVAGQTIQPGGDKGATQSQPQSQPSKGKEQVDKAQPGKPEPGRNAQSYEGARSPSQGTAQGKAPPATSGQAPSRDEERKGQAQEQERKGQGQEQQRQGQSQPRERTQGQAPREQERQQGQTQQRDQERQGQTQERSPQDNQRGGNVQQGERQGERAGGNVSVSLTTEQKTRLRDTVFKEKDAPRVGRVDFSIREGTVVPRTVHIVEVPRVIIDIHPEWRGYMYFIVNDELVIVEPDTLKIVAVIPV